MRLLIYIAIVVGFGLALSGCGSAKPTLTTNTTETVTDSTVTTIRIVPRDTTVTTPKDSVIVKVPLVALTEVPVEQTSSSGNVKAKVRIVNNIIEVECLTEALELKISIQDKEIERLQKIEKLKKIVKTITNTEYRTPWYAKSLAWIGALYLIYLIGRMAFNYFKPI